MVLLLLYDKGNGFSKVPFMKAWQENVMKNIIHSIRFKAYGEYKANSISFEEYQIIQSEIKLLQSQNTQIGQVPLLSQTKFEVVSVS